MNAIQLTPPASHLPAERFGRLHTLSISGSTLVPNGLTGIRPFAIKDIPALYEATRESINELCTWMVWCQPDYSLADSAAFVSACALEWDCGRSHSFVICDAVDGTFLGSAGLNQVNHAHNVANLGYWVRSSQTGRGIASVAVRLVARFGLRELGFNRVDIVVPVGNGASQRVAEKAGARREGFLRHRLMLQGRSRDAVLYSLVAEDFNV